MNPTMKQHRHPGIWSLPQKSEYVSDISLNNELTDGLSSSHPSSNEPVSSELEQLAEALQHSQQQGQSHQRWVTLIGQPKSARCTDVLRLLDQLGIEPQYVRWIRPTDSESCAWAAEQACLLDNSSVVVAWLQDCLPRDAKRLQLVRRHTQADVLLFQQRTEKTPLH